MARHLIFINLNGRGYPSLWATSRLYRIHTLYLWNSGQSSNHSAKPHPDFAWISIGAVLRIVALTTSGTYFSEIGKGKKASHMSQHLSVTECWAGQEARRWPWKCLYKLCCHCPMYVTQRHPSVSCSPGRHWCAESKRVWHYRHWGGQVSLAVDTA